MTDDDWVNAAIADDSIVGHLLIHLNRTPPPTHPVKVNTSASAIPIKWSVRQRRSKTMTLSANKSVSTRASPTTPLSWSGATSGSGGGGGGTAVGGGLSTTVDGVEESSQPLTKRCSSLSRSKVIGTSEATSSKRPRKKKTLAELKVEEDLLLKERKYLNRKLESMRATFEKQWTENESLKRMKKLESMRATFEKQWTENESLKRMKRELSLSESGSKIDRAAAAFVSDKLTPPEKNTKMVAECHDSTSKHLQSRTSLERLEIQDEDSFMLPDLNVAVEEEFS